jgi:thymidylate synthase ThyX
MAYDAKVVCDSMSPDLVRLTTIEVTFPRIVLAEFNTHRMLSRNSASSRAVPVLKRIAMAEETPYVPTAFGRNQKGMQSGAALEGEEASKARDSWLRARDAAVAEAQVMAALGVHKEYANRLLEPFLWHTAIVTATEWLNFWNLRCHKNASEPIRRAAEMMWDAYDRSLAKPREWHLPYCIEDDLEYAAEDRVKICTGRCARVSYLTHDGRRAPGDDVRLHDDLLGNGHMSPLEHAARPATHDDARLAMVRFSDVEVRSEFDGEVTKSVVPADMWFGNFRGWVQYRKLIPGEAVFVDPRS